MKLLVLGAGAIGGYFGGRLAAAGTDVTFLVRPARRAALARDGLRITSPAGDLTLPVQTVEAGALAPGYDVILLTCKAYDLPSAMDAIAPAVGPGTVIVPMLNGMAHLDALDARFGRDAVMGGACAISVTLGADGVIRHMDPMQRIQFGPRTPAQAAPARALADAFARTSVPHELSDAIETAMWEKVAFLSVAAASTCLFRASLGEIARAPGGRDAALHALEVNIATATHAGHRPREAWEKFARGLLSNEASTMKSSMLRDLEAGARVEADHIIGWMLRQARAAGLDSPLLAHALVMLSAYEARRTAS
ncbi:MAG: ketopantoate reductase family protein [Gemmatimonadetes bacterium]|nr:ketopantoate reductase family protein [Gemmatimonadota bacterium]